MASWMGAFFSNLAAEDMARAEAQMRANKQKKAQEDARFDKTIELTKIEERDGHAVYAFRP